MPVSIVRRFDTTELPPSGRSRAWSRNVQDLHFNMSVHIPDQSFFDGALDCYAVDSFQLVSFREPPASFHRGSDHIRSDGCDDVEIIAPIEGECVIEQFGRTAVAPVGSFVMFDATAPMSIFHAVPMSALLLKAKRGVFEQRVSDIERSCAQVIRCDVGIARIAGDFLRSLVTEVGYLAEHEFQSSCSQFVDLVALSLQREAGTADLTALSRDRTLKRIKGYIRKYSANHDLTTSHVASALGLSERYVQVLFKQDSTTPRQYLKEQRLFAAHEQLCNPLYRNKSITQIAFESGFSSSSHFSEAFRAHYGYSPSTLRSQKDAGQSYS